MNRGIYRLVFNRERNVWMAVGEWTRALGKGGRSTRARAVARRAMPAVVGVVLVAATAGALAGQRSAYGVPAVTVVPSGTVPLPSSTFVSSGSVGGATVNTAATDTGKAMTVTQNGLTVVLNWDKFNIAHGSSVTFVQPSSGAAALNRIHDLDPSQIQGQLNANGQVYLYNANGILFGNGAQVNVGGLVASALDIGDDVFQAGLLTAGPTTPAFNWTGSASGFANSLVRVEAGASITTPNGGGVMMFAPRVENLGHIATPEGQTVLAAGAKVYLASPLDSRLRGFLVEVDPFTGTDGSGNAVNLGGTVTNQKLGDQIGEIIAERGNITLAGLAVNQQGHLKVTTSVDRNGSIYLLARDTVSPMTVDRTDLGQGLSPPASLPEAKRMGTLTFGAGSVTEAVPDATDTRTLTDDQAFNPSAIVGAGKVIQLQGAGSEGPGARLTAAGGNVNLTASDSPQCPIGADCSATDPWRTGADGAGAHLYVGSGSVIDVSGVQNVDLSVSRNIVEVELRGTQLADSPLQRNGILAGKKVLVDIRKGTPLANVSAEVSSIARGIQEKSSTGGQVNLVSEGDVAVLQGSTVNVSGGSLNYRGGDVGTSQLNAGGQSFDISQASPDVTYTSYVKHVARYDPGYVEGKDAGSVTVIGNHGALDGNLVGTVTTGIYQRDAGSRPRGGTLNVGKPGDDSRTLLSNVSFTNGGSSLGTGYQLGDALPGTMKLNSSIVGIGGFDKLSLTTMGHVSIPQEVAITTGPKGSIQISAQSVDVQGRLTTPGGNISLASRDTSALTGSSDPADYGVALGSHAVLSAAGAWTSDMRGQQTGVGTDVVAVDGGSISLNSVAGLTLQSGSVVDVGGGGWVRYDGTYQFGNAGTLSLATGRFLKTSQDLGDAMLNLGGTLAGYAYSDGNKAGNGGTLNISTSNVSIGGAATGRAGELHLSGAFFDQGGFRTYSINGYDALGVAGGTRIAPNPQVRLANQETRAAVPGKTGRSAGGAASGAVAPTQGSLAVLPAELRSPTSLTLAAGSLDHGKLTIGQGAALEVDPGGTLKLNAGYAMVVDGTLTAPGGSISLSLPAPPLSNAYQYMDDRAIWLGSHARLLAPGYVRLTPNALDLRQGKVFDGGSISLDAANGYLVTQAGSLVDASGAQTTLDLQAGNVRGSAGPRATSVGSKGGAISLAAREGMLLDGSVRAAGGAGALGGSLAIDAFYQQNLWAPDIDSARQAILSRPRRLLLASTHDAGTAGLTPGQSLNTTLVNGVAVIAADRVAAGGFADLSLTSWDRIEIVDNASFSAARSISLEAPNLTADPGTQLSLAAAQVRLGNTRVHPGGGVVPPLAATAGDGQLEVAADNIDLEGNVALQGFGRVDLVSTGDIRLGSAFYVDSYTASSGDTVVRFDNTGSLHSGGDINLTAARIYPETLADFTFAIDNNPKGAITVTSNGANPASPLSAGGHLTLNAPHIKQNGTLMAPFGVIDLIGDTVDLGSGSLTSVSGRGLTIPFGMTDLSGTTWLYGFGGASKIIDTPPEKRVGLNGDQVNVAKGATIDLSGSGDMSAWEFIAGPGGSKDVLSPANSPNTYAIVPGLGGVVAPYDLQDWQGVTGLHAGDAIKLSNGVAGLAAGTYLLLPARYALLPGAYTVTLTGTLDASPNQTLARPDGSVQTAATRTSLIQGGSLDNARSESVIIAAGAVAQTRSEFKQTLASSYFAGHAGAQQTGDAGRLAIAAGSALTLNGNLDATFSATHRGAEVDIAANLLSVVGTGQSAPTGYVSLSAEALNRLGASSLLLGGTRTATGAGSTISVGAQKVDIDTGAGTELAAPELIVAATDTVTVESGSRVAGKGTYSGTPKDLSVNGDGALLRASSGPQVALTRTGTARARGALDVKSGATVGGQSAIVDATFDNRVEGQVDLAAGGALTVGASRISVGETAGVTEGLVFSNERLAALGNPAALSLKSYSSLDLYGKATLGNAGLEQLAIESAGIVGYGNAGKTAQLTAQKISLANPDGQALSPTGTPGSGRLAVNADTIVMGKGGFNVKGFAASGLTASGEIRTEGAGSHHYDGDLTLSANRITGAAGSKQTITAGGTLTTAATGAETGSSQGYGAALTLSAQRIFHGGHIDLRSGLLTLESTGGAGDSVALAAGSTIDVRGVAQAFADTMAYAPGGNVTLTSDHGDVTVAAAASIDVSGVPGGNAGALTVNATEGRFDNQGSLKGSVTAVAGSSSPQAGKFSLDAKTVTDFNALNDALETGGFFEMRSMRLRSGDIDLAAGKRMTAHQVRLTADAGDIDIAGTIDASGTSGGSIDLYVQSTTDAGGVTAGGNIALENGGALLARATEYLAAAAGTKGRGGRVRLGIDGTGGKIDLKQGSTIDVSVARDAGGNLSQAPQGTVTLRAPRTSDSDLASVAPILSAVEGAPSVIVEANKVYGFGNANTNVDTAMQAQWQRDNNNFMGHAGDIVSSLLTGRADSLAISLQPGIEVRTSGDIALSSDLNLGLTNWRYGTASVPGTLTLRAGGNLNINANLSDGFTTANGWVQLADVVDPTNRDASLPGLQSWGYRLVGGADLASADPTATRSAAAGVGDVVLSANKLVRTGTGDIQVAAAHDLTLGSGAAIYTAGVADYMYGYKTQRVDAKGNPVVDASGNPVYDFGRDYFTFGSLVTKPFGAKAAAQYARDGGDVDIRAGNNISAANTPSWVSQWLTRQGGNLVDGKLPTSVGPNGITPAGKDFRPTWWVSYEKFGSGVGALGGGNVDIAAGGDINSLAVAVPTNGRLYGADGTVPDPANLVVHGGGSLSVSAAGSVTNSQFYVERGQLDVAAGNAQSLTLGMGEAAATVTARGDAQLNAVLNPTMTDQPRGTQTTRLTYFSTYSGVYDQNPTAGVSLSSIYGNITVSNDMTAAGISLPGGSSPLYPGTVRLAALQGSIHVAKPMNLAPAARGQLELLAGGGSPATDGSWDAIRIDNAINMLDLSPTTLPSVFDPQTSNSLVQGLVDSTYEGVLAHSATPLHTGDAVPVRVVALNGDIVNNSTNGIANLPKKALFEAGRDLVGIGIFGQNLSAGDVTQFIAGRDIVEPTRRSSDGSINSNPNVFEWGGPGRVEFIAGRTIDLGASKGIVSRGNLNNPFLPDQGADLFLQAGTTNADYAGFLALLDAPGQALLRQRANYEAALTVFMRKITGNDGLDFAAAHSAFAALSEGRQHALLNALFYAVLRESGRAAAQSNDKSLYDTGYAAIAAMFPGIAQGGGNPYAGDINLFLSQIKTEQGGNIDFMAPGGQINAGLANSGNLKKSAADLGIITARGGDIDAFVSGSFQVNQSRVFALAADSATPSDIMLWSSWGDIDAGRGAKTATATPPPVQRYDQTQRRWILDVANAVSGSGIGALSARDGVDPGAVDLYAPSGVINAGDAGIRAGRAYLGATAIKGADNISVSGGVVGLAAAAAAPSVNVAPPSQSDAATQAAQQAALAGSSGNDRADYAVLMVEVLPPGDAMDAIPAAGGNTTDDEDKKRKKD